MESIVCCIYHKARPVGESSSESSDTDSQSSDTESDSDNDVVGGQNRATRGRCTHEDSRDVDRDAGDRISSCPSRHHHKGKSKRRKPSPNAYERVPKSTTKGYLEKRQT